jgi:hypothetical protein
LFAAFVVYGNYSFQELNYNSAFRFIYSSCCFVFSARDLMHFGNSGGFKVTLRFINSEEFKGNDRIGAAKSAPFCISRAPAFQP